MQLEQLTCDKCGKGYVDEVVKKDHFRLRCVCVSCREKPILKTVSFGKPFIVSADLTEGKW